MIPAKFCEIYCAELSKVFDEKQRTYPRTIQITIAICWFYSITP